MVSAIREQLHIHAEFEQSLTRLCLVVQGFTPAEMGTLKSAVRSASAKKGKPATEVIDDCIDEVLMGTPFDSTYLGILFTMLGGI